MEEKKKVKGKREESGEGIERKEREEGVGGNQTSYTQISKQRNGTQRGFQMALITWQTAARSISETLGGERRGKTRRYTRNTHVKRGREKSRECQGEIKQSALEFFLPSTQSLFASSPR